MSRALLARARRPRGAAAGIWLGGHPENLPGPVRDALVQEDRALRAEIIDSIEKNFYKRVDDEKLDESSLKGLVDALNDPVLALPDALRGAPVHRGGER